MNKRSVYSIYTKYFIFSELMRYSQEQKHTHVKHTLNMSKAIKEEHASTPNLVIKQELVSDRINSAMNPLFQTVTENGKEIIELLDSDQEMEPVDASVGKGISNTTVGEFDTLKAIKQEHVSDRIPITFNSEATTYLFQTVTENGQ